MKKLATLLLIGALCVSAAACASTASAAGSQSSAGAKTSTVTAAVSTDTAAAEETEESAQITREIRLKDSTGSVAITEEGVYRISGSLSDGQIIVNAPEAQVTLLLDGVEITAQGSAAIYVADADKVKIELAEGSENTLRSTGEFADPQDESIDAAIFSHDDLTIKGTGSLTVESEQGHGIVSKDDLKITGGDIAVTAAKKALSGQDSVEIKGGELTLRAGTDGVRSDGEVIVNGGTLDIQASEGIEAAYVEINDGEIAISASDDGINATRKNSEYTAHQVSIVINGGKLSITMAAGDTDALDSNGSLIINGGQVDINAQFAFDFDTVGQLNGGTVTVNGSQVTSISNSMLGGGFGGGQMGGGQGGFGGQTPGGQGGSFGGRPSGGPGGFGGWH